MKQTVELALTIQSQSRPNEDFYLSGDRNSIMVRPNKVKSVLCYAIHSPEVPMKMDAKKAKALGVTKGQDMGKLSRGEPVTLSNGTVVTTADCTLAEARPGPILMVIACPEPNMIDNLVNHPEFSPYFLNGEFNSPNPQQIQVSVIAHLAPAHVLASPTYQTWMKRFGPHVEHMFVDQTVCQPEEVSAEFTQLNDLTSQIDFHSFGLSSMDPSPRVEVDPELKVTVAEVLTTFQAQPLDKVGYQKRSLPTRKPKIDVMSDPNVVTTLQKFQSDNFGPSESEEYVITFLGTGAASANNVRNGEYS